MKPVTTKKITLPDDHWHVLEQETALTGMSVDQMLAHSVRLMQTTAIRSRCGLRLSYVDEHGREYREKPLWPNNCTPEPPPCR